MTKHIADLRNDFRIFGRRVHGRRLVYLDSAATSHKPGKVLDAVRRFYEHSNANVHSAIHTLGFEASDAYETARKDVADFIGAKDPHELIFTRNATEALNLLAGGLDLQKGDVILLTQMEHHSNIVPWQMAAQKTGAKIRFIPVTPEGMLDMAQARRMIADKPKIVSVTHVSNVLGTINPVRELCGLAHAAGAMFFIDAVQSVPHMPFDISSIGADAVVLSGHKMLGPMGIGALWARMSILNTLKPHLGGGGMIKEVSESGFVAGGIPRRFEAGTPNVAGAIGLAAAIAYLRKAGMENVAAHERTLTAYALDRLSGIKGLTLYGPADLAVRAGVISFNLADMHAHDVGSVLDSRGVAVRAGHHCAQPLMDALGITATCRASFYIYNTREDVDELVAALEYAREVFRL